MDSDLSMTVNGEDSYRVEVSGWDAKENFFVEKTTLEWKPDDKKSMLLRSDIAPGLYRVCPAAPTAGNGRQFSDRL